MKELLEINEKLSYYVEHYQALIKRKLHKESSVDELKEKMLRIENDLKQGVFEQVDDSGKKRFSNQEMRDVALFKFLGNHDVYKIFKSELCEVERSLGDCKGELDISNKRLSVLFKQADIFISLNNSRAKFEPERVGGVKDE